MNESELLEQYIPPTQAGLLAFAGDVALYFGGVEYANGLTDATVGAFRYRDPGTINKTSILFGAERYRDDPTEIDATYEYELEFTSSDEIEHDELPEGLLTFARQTMARYNAFPDLEEIYSQKVVETFFELDSDGRFEYSSEVYYQVNGHEFVVNGDNVFAERYSRPARDDVVEDSETENDDDDEQPYDPFKELEADAQELILESQYDSAIMMLKYLLRATLEKAIQ